MVLNILRLRTASKRALRHGSLAVDDSSGVKDVSLFGLDPALIAVAPWDDEGQAHSTAYEDRSVPAHDV